MTTSDDGWYLEDLVEWGGAELVVATSEFGATLFLNTPDDVVVATRGPVIGRDGESLAVGLNVFRHTCLVSCNMWAMTGSS